MARSFHCHILPSELAIAIHGPMNSAPKPAFSVACRCAASLLAAQTQTTSTFGGSKDASVASASACALLEVTSDDVVNYVDGCLTSTVSLFTLFAGACTPLPCSLFTSADPDRPLLDEAAMDALEFELIVTAFTMPLLKSSFKLEMTITP